MLVETTSCRRCHRINPRFARYCGLCGARLCSRAHTTNPLGGLIWAAIITVLFILFFAAIVSRPAPRRLLPHRLVWPDHPVMLNHSGAHSSTAERTVSAPY